eukprot:3182086-Rhodomonas_salina.2
MQAYANTPGRCGTSSRRYSTHRTRISIIAAPALPPPTTARPGPGGKRREMSRGKDEKREGGTNTFRKTKSDRGKE